jgi:hypothetical protein
MDKSQETPSHRDEFLFQEYIACLTRLADREASLWHRGLSSLLTEQ